ncbi:MAG: sulfatase [Phycisphaerales bacterium]|nr:MAG: sulfatase [Phycisphaerales bacterium]
MITACRPAEDAGPPPEFNVVLISVDTLRADRLNCYGYKKREVSPNIDALAADGVLFENFITSSPWTTPTHLTMFTSLYPTTHGVTQPIKELKDSLREGTEFTFNKLPDSRVTLAEVLKASGYATGAFTGGGTMDPRIGFDQGFDHYEISMYKLHRSNMRDMYEWIERHAERPFLLFWHTYEVHAPYLQGTFLDEVLPPDIAAAAKEFLNGVDGIRVRRGPGATEHDNIIWRSEQFLRSRHAFTAEVTGALYDGGIHSFDDWLGKFVQELRDRGLYEDALVILTSDHGEEFGEHNLQCIYQNHGHSVYEEMVRVPLIIKLPHQRHAGTRVSSTVRMIDLMPTILDILGVSRPPKDMQGLSLRPLWEQPETQQDRLAISEALIKMEEKKAVRTGRYKFIYSLDADTVAQHGRSFMPKTLRLKDVELYDLRVDPAEKTNLLRFSPSLETAKLAATLEQHLRDFVAGAHGRADTVELDEETIENLKALGYFE